METRTLLQSSITTSLNFYTHQLSSLSLINAKPFHFQRSHTTSLPPAKVTKPITPTLRISPSRCSLQDEQLPGADKNVVGQDHSVALKNKAAEISSQLKGTSIFLVGINNNIKAKLGNVLADMLRYYYFDSDSLVEQAAGGEAAAKSFREKDDKGFLESEVWHLIKEYTVLQQCVIRVMLIWQTEVLRQLSSMGRLVICTGDGAVKSSTNLSFMRHGISIWIDVPIVVLAKEVKESGNQPPPDDVILNSDPSKAVAKLTELFERMRGGYATADATISLQKVASQLGYDDTDAVTIEDMAMEAFREIEKLTRVKKMMEAAARPF